MTDKRGVPIDRLTDLLGHRNLPAYEKPLPGAEKQFHDTLDEVASRSILIAMFRSVPSRERRVDWPPLALAFSPAIVYFVRTALLDDPAGFNAETAFWLVWFASIAALGVGATVWLWRRLAAASSDIVAPIRSQDDVDTILRLVSGPLTGRLPQWGVALVSALTFCVLLQSASPAFEATIPVVPESYVAVALLAVLGSNGVYWLVSFTQAITAYSRLPSLAAYWLEPAETPAFVRLSVTAGWAAVIGALAVLAGVLPVLRAASVAEDGSGPTVDRLLYALLIIGVLLLAYWSFRPQNVLSIRIAWQHRRSLRIILDALNAELARSPIDGDALTVVESTYEVARSSRQYTLRGEVLVQYVVVAVTLAASVVLPVVSNALVGSGSGG